MALASNPLLTLSAVATVAIAAGRAVTQSGAIAPAAGRSLGVSRTSAAIGDRFPVDVDGTSIGEAGAAVALEAELEVDAQGRYITKASGKTVARALSAATAAGQMMEILLIAN